MSANQLLEKALSTTSEDEAIACLVMARKKGLKLSDQKQKQIQDLQKELAIVNSGVDYLIKAKHNLIKENDRMSKELEHYQASLIVTVVCFSLALLFSLLI